MAGIENMTYMSMQPMVGIGNYSETICCCINVITHSFVVHHHVWVWPWAIALTTYMQYRYRDSIGSCVHFSTAAFISEDKGVFQSEKNSCCTWITLSDNVNGNNDQSVIAFDVFGKKIVLTNFDHYFQLKATTVITTLLSMPIQSYLYSITISILNCIVESDPSMITVIESDHDRPTWW